LRSWKPRPFVQPADGEANKFGKFFCTTALLRRERGSQPAIRQAKLAKSLIITGSPAGIVCERFVRRQAFDCLFSAMECARLFLTPFAGRQEFLRDRT
jgi:hypothetical protein